MRHDYNPQHVNGAVIAVAAVFIASGLLLIIGGIARLVMAVTS
jgi:hypothetical protein